MATKKGKMSAAAGKTKKRVAKAYADDAARHQARAKKRAGRSKLRNTAGHFAQVGTGVGAAVGMGAAIRKGKAAGLTRGAVKGAVKATPGKVKAAPGKVSASLGKKAFQRPIPSNKTIKRRKVAGRAAGAGAVGAGGYTTYKRRTPSGKTITVKRRKSAKK